MKDIKALSNEDLIELSSHIFEEMYNRKILGQELIEVLSGLDTDDTIKYELVEWIHRVLGIVVETDIDDYEEFDK